MGVAVTAVQHPASSGQLPRSALWSWPELWRYPELLRQLATGQSQRPAPPESMDGRAAAKAVVEGIATAWSSPAEVFAEFLRMGEHGSARALLDHAPATPTLAETGRAELERTVERSREQLSARCLLLSQRAVSVGLAERPPAGADPMDAVEWSQPEAEARLERWRGQIEAEVATRKKRLHTELQFVTGRMAESGPSHDPQTALWEEAVRRCIEEGYIDEADRLLQQGGGLMPPGSPPVLPPTPPRWGWNEPLTEIIGWFEGRPAPPGFDRWRPDADDREAAAVVATLQRLASGGSADEGAVADLAGAIEMLVGASPAPDREVAADNEGFLTVLRGLADPRLPGLRAAAGGALPFWVSRHAELVPPAAQVGVVTVCFSLEPSPPLGRGLVGINARTLLPLLHNRPYRRLRLLRELGIQIPLAEAIPEGAEDAAGPGPLGLDSRDHAAWLLKLLGVDTEIPVLDALVYYGGYRADLLYALLRRCLSWLPDRSTRLSDEVLARAFNDLAFQEEAQQRLLAPIREDRLAMAVLAALVLLADEPALDAGQVVEALALLWERQVPLPEAERALDRLAAAALLEPHGGYHLPSSGIRTILRGLDLEELTGEAPAGS
jgi:hypothetical protein